MAGDAGPTGRENSAPTDPSTHQLRLFLLLAEEMHFGRAAKRVFMTQPAFSQQIRSLERRLGLTLVDRTTRTAGLTPSGQELLPEIRAMVQAADRLRQVAGERVRTLSGRVVIGSFEAITSVHPIPEILEELKARHPGIEVEIVRTGFADSAATVLAGGVDAAFLFPPVPPGIQTQRLADLRRVVCLATSDPLADAGPLTLSRLSGRRNIGWSPEIPKVWRDFWAVDPRPDGSPARYTAHQIAEFEPALTAIALGEGVQFPPEPARWLYQRHGVAYAEVTDLPPCHTALAWRTRDRDRPIVTALRRATRTVLDRLR
ncbi:LysR family transcriptional regulator [Streptomyces ochraceiscleroticus]|uniref:LysR family transcriptional regulator n=1 Tax=Streptomyces ochraceiscleroticus TaxID=47761 RepID=A0ABW1MM94_9ACTN|nr:LysR family transcriptional regulator [Streptomyces ochraceiscleroticus]